LPPVAFMAPAEALVEPSAVGPVLLPLVPLDIAPAAPLPIVADAAGEPGRAVSDVPFAEAPPVAEPPVAVCAMARQGPAIMSATEADRMILRI